MYYHVADCSNDSLRDLDSRVEDPEVADEVRDQPLRTAFQEEAGPEEDEDNVSAMVAWN